MRLRDLIIIVTLLACTVLVSLLAIVMGSEVYFFLPSRHGGIDPPPDHPATYIVLLAIVVGLFFFSARYAAIALTTVAVGSYLALGIGMGVFEWTPGICHYLLMLLLTLTTIFVWDCEEFHSD